MGIHQVPPQVGSKIPFSKDKEQYHKVPYSRKSTLTTPYFDNEGYSLCFRCGSDVGWTRVVEPNRCPRREVDCLEGGQIALPLHFGISRRCHTRPGSQWHHPDSRRTWCDRILQLRHKQRVGCHLLYHHPEGSYWWLPICCEDCDSYPRGCRRRQRSSKDRLPQPTTNQRRSLGRSPICWLLDWAIRIRYLVEWSGHWCGLHGQAD